MSEFKVKERKEKEIENLAGYPEFLRILLWNRGIKSKEEADKFILPDYEGDLHNPFLLPDMDKAVERILEAIEKDEKIVIFSDYDADGIPGAVILHDFFKKINYHNFYNYIPHRHNEGFGLNGDVLEEFIKNKVKLIITVDCGIADIDEADLFKKNKIDLIITDHHSPKEKLPDCLAVVDAKRNDSLDGQAKYPFADLCGAGVAFKLVQAILVMIRKSPSNYLGTIGIPIGYEKWLLDMVAIATLSDMVPLVGENRVLAYYGLKVLRKSPRLGLIKLLRLLRIEQSQITEEDVGFSISPRINAASRMGDPEDAFKLFVAETDEEADICARHLDKINNERKGVVASMVKEVRKIMEKRLSEVDVPKKVLVIGNPDWKPSLLGLVANSLKDDHNCPVFLWGRDGGNVLKGSCRGDGCVGVLDLMNEVEAGIFIEYGGHAMSGGFSLVQDKVHLLEEKLQMAYEKVIGADSVSPKLQPSEAEADMKISLAQVNMENYKLLEKLAPFGVGNPKPLFLFEKVEIKEVRNFGKENNHLEIILRNTDGRDIKAIGFFTKLDDFPARPSGAGGGTALKAGDKINLLANLEFSLFGGRSELRLRIVDLTPNPSP